MQNRSIFTLIALLLNVCYFTGTSYAQVANDECSTGVDLGVVPYCEDEVFYTNQGATASTIGLNNIPGCWDNGTVQRDVWFSFIASDTILDYLITVTGKSNASGSKALKNPQIAIYRGDCTPDDLFFYACAKGIAGSDKVELTLNGLTPGATYYLRVSDYPQGGTNAGTFVLCIEEKPPITIITNGSSNACNGELCDSGGPTGDYKNDEKFTYVICPATITSCIEFQLKYYHIDNQSDTLAFYDGQGVNSPLIAALTQFSFPESGGGAVCYNIQASSGCLTVRFSSDNSATFEGFCGTWSCSNSPCIPKPTIQVSPDPSTTLIANSLATPQTVLTVTNVNCAEGAYATFAAADNTNLGAKKGLLLTTGQATNAIGPNNSSSLGTNNGAGFEDPELDSLSILNGNGSLSHDACSVELDVYVNTDELSFEYIFGSEEYPEFVNSSFNDIFAFLVSGPGIQGIPQIGNKKNIAVLPDANSTFVQINSVNNEQNWQYYRNNANNNAGNGQSVQYDGMTSDKLGIKKTLTAHTKVTPCNTYKLRLAIADRGDGAYDSGVFISEIKGGGPSMDLVFNSGVDYLAENCTGDKDSIVIFLGQPLDDTITYFITITGTAIKGTDYLTNIPATITFLPGQQIQKFSIKPIQDNTVEPLETIIISLNGDFGCGAVNFVTKTIDLRDEPYVAIEGDKPSIGLCAGVPYQIKAKGTVNYFWEPVSLFDDPLSQTPTVTITQDTKVFVTGTIDFCVAHDTILLKVIKPEVKISNADPITLCTGDTVTLAQTNNVGNAGLSWSTNFGNLIKPKTLNPKLFAFTNGQVYVQVDTNNCKAFDTLNFNYIFYSPAIIIDPTVDICQGESTTLAFPTFSTTTDYTWTPPIYLNAANISNPICTPQDDVTYQVISKAKNAACADTAYVVVNNIPNEVHITNPDTIYLCKGDSAILNATSPSGGTNFTWITKDPKVSGLTTPTVVVKPNGITWYKIQLTSGPCATFDSVLVWVDSIPVDMKILAIPTKPVYCVGDTIAFVAKNFDKYAYPFIYHYWQPDLGSISDSDSSYNYIIMAVESATYTRYTINHACKDTNSITITVIQVNPELNLKDTSICPGETVTLSLLDFDQYDKVTWSPAGILSCTNCATTIATPVQPTGVTVKVENEGCPSEASAFINFNALPPYVGPAKFSICAGESLNLNPITGSGFGNYQWKADDVVFSTSASPIVTPTKTTVYKLHTEFGGCEKDFQFEITVFPTAYIASITKDTILCKGQSVTLTANVTGNGAGSWDPGNLTGTSITVSPLSGTQYTFKFLPEGGVCPVLQDTVNVGINDQPPVKDPEKFLICIGDTVNLNPTSDAPFGTYQWSVGGVGFSNLQSPLVHPLVTTQYNLVTKNGNCQWNYDYTINVQNLAGFIKFPGDTIICKNDAITLEAQGNGPGLISWGEPVNSSSNPVIVNLQNSEMIFVTFTPEGNVCDPISDSVTITVLSTCEILIPNIITPNKNEKNETFKIITSDAVKLNSLKIYNRWGNVVFETNDKTEGWDGTRKGNPVPMDLYVYVIEVQLPTGVTKTFKGELNVIR